VLRLHRCGIAGAPVTRWHNQHAAPSFNEDGSPASLAGAVLDALVVQEKN
jgi:hypothetical protein